MIRVVPARSTQGFLNPRLWVTKVLHKLVVEDDLVLFAVGPDLTIPGVIGHGAAIQYLLRYSCWEKGNVGGRGERGREGRRGEEGERERERGGERGREGEKEREGESKEEEEEGWRQGNERRQREGMEGESERTVSSVTEEVM